MKKKECKTADECIMYYLNARCSKDRMDMNKSVIPCLQLLKKKGHNEIMPFAEELTNYGFKPKDIARLILKFLEVLENDHVPVKSINTRVIIRGNNFDRNNILNRLAFEHEDKFMKFLENYDKLKESKMLILSSFEDLIEQGKNNKTVLLSHNLSTEEIIDDENEEHSITENGEHISNENVENEQHPLNENDENSINKNEENLLKNTKNIFELSNLSDTDSFFENEEYEYIDPILISQMIDFPTF